MNKNEAYPTAVYPCIPATPRYGYAVCCGVSKFTTVPVPVVPVLETPRVFPYPWQTLWTILFGRGQISLQDYHISPTVSSNIFS